MGKIAPDKNSVAITTSKNWAAQPDSGSQKVSKLTKIRRLKKITTAKIRESKKING